MSVLDIVLWPDARLTETCVQVEEITQEIRTLAQDMLDTMYAAQGRGLAASQVGSLNRLFVMDIGWKEGKSDPLERRQVGSVGLHQSNVTRNW